MRKWSHKLTNEREAIIEIEKRQRLDRCYNFD